VIRLLCQSRVQWTLQALLVLAALIGLLANSDFAVGTAFVLAALIVPVQLRRQYFIFMGRPWNV